MLVCDPAASATTLMFVAKPSWEGAAARYWILIVAWTLPSALAKPLGMTVANRPSALLTVPGGAVLDVPVVAEPPAAPDDCELVLEEDEVVRSKVVLLPHPAMAEALRIRAARRLARIAVEANRSAPVRRLQSVRVDT